MNKYVVTVLIDFDKGHSELYTRLQELDLDGVLAIEKDERTQDRINIVKCFDNPQDAINFKKKYRKKIEEAEQMRQERINCEMEKERAEREREEQERMAQIKNEVEEWHKEERRKEEEHRKMQVVADIQLVECSEEEFWIFIHNYPGKLRYDAFYMTPAQYSYYDDRVRAGFGSSKVAWYMDGIGGYKSECKIWNKPIEEIREIVKQYKGGTNNE